MGGTGEESAGVANDGPGVGGGSGIAETGGHDVRVNGGGAGGAGGPAPLVFVVFGAAGVVAAVAQGDLFIEGVA